MVNITLPFYIPFEFITLSGYQQYQYIGMKEGYDVLSDLTQQSVGLKPIYDKVEEIKRLSLLKKESVKKVQFVKTIEPVSKKDLIMTVDRAHFLQKHRQSVCTLTQFNRLPPSNILNKRKASSQNILYSKTDRLFNFLRTQQDFNPNNKKPPTPTFKQEQEKIEEREKFTPIRPISRISYPAESLSGTSVTKKSGSHGQSSGGYSQRARLSNSFGRKKQTRQYLRKGHRIRQTLLKQIDAPQNIGEEQELVYLRQYDQWVPQALATYKKLQLEHFLNIILGSKKSDVKEQVKFEPIYL